MPRSARDTQLTELKDTISKLNELIMTQTKSMDSLQKTIERLRQELGTDGEKNCPFCGTQMVPSGTGTVRTEPVFHPAYLERVDYMATTYECPACKDFLEPQFVILSPT
ncbi:MAG: hypothetical protein K2K90_19905 [Lachnospiraceae bacterium]|nr:hypothetical protein [Lachnospiraceae bacterium]